MKERRHAGATHSFRLTMRAAALVDSINYPRRLGGKSRKVSDAIEAYFGSRIAQDGSEIPSYQDLLLNIAALQARLIESGQKLDEVTSSGQIPDNKAQNGSNTPHWWDRFFFWRS